MLLICLWLHFNIKRSILSVSYNFLTAFNNKKDMKIIKERMKAKF